MSTSIIKNFSIEIKDILMSSRLTLFRLNSDVQIDEIKDCPACLGPLQTTAVLIGNDQKQKIRVGVCNVCGYLGYKDRPTLSWLKKFYSDDWDKEFIRSPEQMKKDIVLQRGGVKGSRACAFELYKKLPVSKDRPYFEIGSGYGQVMKNFELAGFKKLYGIENSKHRVELVHDVFGFKIFHGDFGNPDITKEIKKFGPYGLIFSHHVLEHVYDPGKIVQAMFELQEEGDHAIFAIPNVAGEHINYVSLYWPHIHGFTKKSLEMLFNRYGYELVVDESPNVLNIIMAFRKTKNPISKIKQDDNYVEQAKQRFIKGLALDRIGSEGSHVLKWEQKITEQDTSSIKYLKGSRIMWYVLQCISYIKSRVFKRLTPYYIMLVKPSKKMVDDGCIEIHFKRDIVFLIK